MAYPPRIIPSTTAWGSPSMRLRSMKAPGSPSSPLARTYRGSPEALRQESHLVPVGKPPPPRPRSPESVTARSTSSGVIPKRAFSRAE